MNLLRAGILFFSLSLAGCSTLKNLPPKVLKPDEWVGTWMGTQKSFYGIESEQGLVLYKDGTGFLVDSAIFHPEKGQHWIRQIGLTWKTISSNEISVLFGQPVDISGAGSGGKISKKPVVVSSTATGLHIDHMFIRNASFLKRSSVPDPNLNQKIVNNVMAQMAPAMARSQMNGGMTPNQMAGLFLAGAGLGSAAAGNLEVGQALMNQGLASYQGLPPGQSPYTNRGKNKPPEFDSRANGTDAQIREAYPDGIAWDVYYLSATSWVTVYGANTASKDSYLATGNALIGANVVNKNRVIRSYKPYSGMRIAVVPD